ncbi:nitrate reductase cytochrome c-type subunit [Kiloniella sp.]|uniref:nitrate reductase cytochrome c-type subunit n=1 Tax=Kiloniella sp. TaxID=1938587 RepID=UPI003B02D20C
MKRFLIHLTTAVGLIAFANVALSDGEATLRQGEPITTEPAAPKMNKVENKDVKRVRNYPEQPPTIPHKVRSYEISTNANKCMSCHARTRTGESQAPMVSITHYMDRDNQVLATVSPRRYFCNQCHVTQVDAPPLVENEFTDVEQIIKAE